MRRALLVLLVVLLGPILLPPDGHAFDEEDLRLLKQNNACYQCDLRNVVLSGEILHIARLGNSNLVGAHLDRIEAYEADLSGADLTNADLSGARMLFSLFVKANLTKANLGDAMLAVTDMRQAVLVEANLSRANLGSADLRGVDLTGAFLYRTILYRTKLIGAKGLTQAQLDTACGNETTILPPGLTVRPC
jgi:uncharacterized protein YjbI with pentapeptide repeats